MHDAHLRAGGWALFGGATSASQVRRPAGPRPGRPPRPPPAARRPRLDPAYPGPISRARAPIPNTTLPSFPRSALQKQVIDPLNKFVREVHAFVSGCSRPDKDFVKIATAVAVGFAVVGGTGYLVKFVHIPITPILIGN